MHDVSIGTAPRYNPYFRPTPCRAIASMPEDSNAGCSRAVTVSLEEEDIEGATLDEPLETRTIPQLRWCLLCHGIEPVASEKKPRLIKRYIQVLYMFTYASTCILYIIISSQGSAGKDRRNPSS